MEKNLKKISDGTYELTLSEKEGNWTIALDKSFKKLSKELKVDGFRKGHAPENLIKGKISNEDLFNEAINIYLMDNFDKIIQEENLNLFDQPHFHVEKISNKEIEFRIELIVAPRVILGEYKNLKIEKDIILVTDDEIDSKIEELQKENAELEIKENSEVINGDIALIDFKGFLNDVAFEGGEGKDYELEIGSKTFIPGFEEQIIGMKKGETRDLEIKFPANYHEHLANKDAVFKVDLKEIKTKHLPNIDDDLALDANVDNVSTLEELKKYYYDQLVKEKERQAIQSALNKVIDNIIKNSKLEISKELIVKEVNYRLEQIKKELEQKKMKFEDYLKENKLDEKSLEEKTKEQTLKNLKYAFTVLEIAKLENIIVSDSDLDNHLESIAAMYGQSLNDIKKLLGDNIEQFKQELLFTKVFDFLKEVNNL